MMGRLAVRVLWLFVIVFLGLAACSSPAKKTEGIQDGELATSDSLEAPVTSAAEPSAVADGSQFVETRVYLEGLNYESSKQVGLQSYRREMMLRYEAGTGASAIGSWRIDTILNVAEAPATKLLEINFEGDASATEMQSMTLGEIDGLYFLSVPGVGCVSTSEQDFEQASSGIIDPDYYLYGLVGAPLMATGEIVNGVPALDFGLDDSILPRFAAQELSVDGHFYVAEEDGRPLRVLLNVVGEADFAATGRSQDGTLLVEINWFKTSGSDGLNLPSDCLRSALYPLPEDSFNITSIIDLVGFDTMLSVEQVVAFYQSEMAATGWAEVEEPTLLDNSAFMSFSRNGIEVIVNVEAVPETGQTSVVISP